MSCGAGAFPRALAGRARVAIPHGKGNYAILTSSAFGLAASLFGR
jgi:hypothetical protein